MKERGKSGMKSNQEIIVRWTEITKTLDEKVKELKKLDEERDLIKNNIHKEKDLKLMKQMELSLEKYKLLLEEVKVLKLESERLKKQVDKND